MDWKRQYWGKYWLNVHFMQLYIYTFTGVRPIATPLPWRHMLVRASQIIGNSTVCSTGSSGKKIERKHYRFFVRSIRRWSVDFLPKGPIMRNGFSYHDVIIFALAKTPLKSHYANITIDHNSREFKNSWLIVAELCIHATLPHEILKTELVRKQHKIQIPGCSAVLFMYISIDLRHRLLGPRFWNANY